MLARPRPLIFQEREPYEFQSLTNANLDFQVFATDQYLYGIRARVNAGFGFWQMAYGSRQTLNAANYAAARAAMRSLTADGGRPLGVSPTLLVVPPALEEAGLTILNTANQRGWGNERLEGSGHCHDAELVVTPYLI